MPQKCPLWAGWLAPLSLGTAAQQGFGAPIEGTSTKEAHWGKEWAFLPDAHPFQLYL